MSPGASRSPDTRVYRAVLWLCPSGFRREFADEMVRDFDDAHSEVTSMGARDMWRLRLVMAVDLVRTASVQWARTGLPVIAVLSLTVALALAEGLATVARHATFEIPVDGTHAEAIGVLLLATISVFLIAMTMVLTLWVWRPVRPGRR
jgi:hypothetical protein